jgi:hypothetical protein
LNKDGFIVFSELKKAYNGKVDDFEVLKLILLYRLTDSS